MVAAIPRNGATSRDRPRRADGQAAPLAFDRVSMVFPDGTEAVRDASFAVDTGELVAVVGASGCGKSTLLRVAAGLGRPTGGRADVDRGRLGYVFQDPSRLPWRSVAGNVGLLSELHGVGQAERRLMARDAIALVGL